jgi:hypothetical protein
MFGHVGKVVNSEILISSMSGMSNVKGQESPHLLNIIFYRGHYAMANS